MAFLVARGFSNKKVAHELGLKEGTVKSHLSRVFRKLGAKRKYDLIVQVSGEAKQRPHANKKTVT
ncbi:MAG: response regulator transcription factor [Beijerinckiaceae bacterium]